MDRLDAEFLANWSCYSGVVLVELAGGENWSPACGHAGVVSRWELWCGRSDHVDTGCRGLGGSRGACRIVPIGRSLGRHLAGWSDTVESVLGQLSQCIRAVGLTHGLARGNRLAR